MPGTIIASCYRLVAAAVSGHVSVLIDAADARGTATLKRKTLCGAWCTAQRRLEGGWLFASSMEPGGARMGVSQAGGVAGGIMLAPRARLIYHPRREFRRFGETGVSFDSPRGNQDPYLWNTVFLHSYCHITQFHAEAGDINVWVSGDRFPDFTRLYCDLVFVVASKCRWSAANDLSPGDPLVDSAEAWADHYRWHGQHPLARRSRWPFRLGTVRDGPACMRLPRSIVTGLLRVPRSVPAG
jgi:hypothetical protein